MLFADQVGPEFREFSFTKAGKPVTEFLRGDKSQDGVAQKFHLLVVTHPGTARRLQRLKLARLGTVGQGLFQQLYPLEAVAQRYLQQRDVTRLHDLVRGVGPRTSDLGPEGWIPRSDVRGQRSGLRTN